DGGPPFRLPHAYHISAAEHDLLPSLSDPYALDRLGCYMRNMDRVIVSAPFERRQDWSLMLKGSGVNGEVICSVVRQMGAIGVHHYDESGQSALHVATGPLGMRARATKRLFDVTFAGFGLFMLAPLLLVVALLIKLQDGGPVMFMQRRLGRGNRFFNMYKFRTMKADKGDPDGRRSASLDDDRITPIGRILRKTSIDELPQLLNVLGGQMSMVGPRPHAIGSQAGDKSFWEIDRRYWQRHSLKPGLTGLAQVRGLRGATHQELDLQLRLRSDLEYLDGWSIWRDLHIVIMTLRVVVHAKAF
ncbi:MAG: sugar transferase, partial [Oxalobacteraceae bacterium]